MIGTAIGNYVVRSKLGEGGMGAVYIAEHARLARRVVVKVLLPQLGRDPQTIARFFNEAKAATDIKNEHIVDVLDFGELPDGTSYIVMEWLEGQSLGDALRQGALPVARVVHIARGMSQALGAAHARGIVHRDLKPDNVFLVVRDRDHDFVKVLDFGIAKLALSNAGDVRTQTGAIMGTPLYMAPEQINGANVDARTDVYAMGIIVYQMLTGVLPFDTTTLTDLLIAHATKTPTPLRAHDPSIPVAIESAVLRALEKDPARRFESVDAFVNALDASPQPSALAATFAPPATSSGASRSSSSALPLILIGGGVGALAIAAIVGVVVLRDSSPSKSAVADSPPPPSAPPQASTTTITAASASVTPSATSSAPTPTASNKTTTRWKLATTDCPAGAMPASVETTRNGASVVTRSFGFPDAIGTASPDGKFRAHNALGTCIGTANERVVTETCTNNFQMSCHATYQRAD